LGSRCPGLTITLLVIAALFRVILLFNFLGGPTCQCHLRTAVQTEELGFAHRD